jgi:Mlc titration factor MtfA (ptsG expression regulator)
MVINTGEMPENFKTNTFNKVTGKWEANDPTEVHIVINDDVISQNTKVGVIMGEFKKEDIESEIDYDTHNVEVHEGTHAIQDGYDFSIVDENGNDTGIPKPYIKRTAEHEAKAAGEKAEKELRNQKQ